MATVAAPSAPVASENSDGFGRALAKAAALFLLSYLAATLAWILIPALALGWVPLVVTSGSMAPTINRGDVVIIEPGVPPIPGQVVAFADPSGTPTLHRLERINDDGTFTTRGDANSKPDSTPITAVNGVGRLLVPALGFVKLWLPEGGTSLPMITGGLIALLARRRWATLLAAGIVVGSGLFVASAAFASATANSGSSLTTLAIGPPSNLLATCSSVAAGGDVPIQLTWTASATPGASYEISYDAPPPGGGFVVVGSTASTAFTHTIANGGLALGQPHTFAVRATLGPWSSAVVEDQVTITQVLLLYVCS